MNQIILQTKNLRKSFGQVGGKNTSVLVEAVKGVDLEVHAGEIFGFLGPNGAGKTTTLRMLATLLTIDEGEATIAGYSVKAQAGKVRAVVGYVSQLGGADEQAPGREDLVLQGQLYGMSLEKSKKRANELIEMLELVDFADRKISTYSGGQRRRLDICLGLMHKPKVLFLDEPSTGLDPQNRANLWDQIRKLRDGGTTIFLTTHYLEEADMLCDRLAIMDHGVIVASGTPRDLKNQIAGDAILIKPKVKSQELDKIQKYLSEQEFVREIRSEGESLRLYVDDGALCLPKIFNLLEKHKVALDMVSLMQPSLDDVFLKQTGRSLRDAGNKKLESEGDKL